MKPINFSAIATHKFEDDSLGEMHVTTLGTDQDDEGLTTDDIKGVILSDAAFRSDMGNNSLHIHSKEQWEQLKKIVDLAFDLEVQQS